MESLTVWLAAGNPPHYMHLVMLALMVLEYVLGKTDKVKPNSTLDLLLHIVTGGLKDIMTKNEATNKPKE